MFVASRRLTLLPLLALLCGLLAPLAVPPRPAQAAAPAFVQTLGSNTGGQPITITTTAAVTAGNSIIVALDTVNGGLGSLTPGVPTCSDPVNGTYDVDVTAALDLVSDLRMTVCSKHNAAATPAGTIITVTWGNSDGSQTSAVAVEFSGLTANPRDKTASAAGGFNDTADSGVAPATAQARELLVAAIGRDGADLDGIPVTFGTNGTTTACASGGTPTYTKRAEQLQAFSVGISLGDCAVAATGTYRASGTLAHDGFWQAAIVTYIAADQPPTVTTTNTPLTYTENSGAVAIDPGVTVIDPDSLSLTGATVSITGNFTASEDSLQFVNQGGISGSYNAMTGVLTLTGNASPAAYQAALGSVTYTNSSESPSTATRTVTFSVSDGAPPAGTATRQINVFPLPEPPVVTTSPGAASFTENGGPVAIDPGLTIVDVDSATLTGATVALNPRLAEDGLVFVDQNGITGTIVPSPSFVVLTLSGTASVAAYQAALRSVTYANTSDTPNPFPRTVSFQVTDDTATASSPADRQIAITVGNDPPVNTVPAAQTTPGNTPRVFSAANLNAISVADVDAGGADVQTALSVPAGQGALAPGAAGTVPPLTTVTGSGTNSLTLRGSIAAITAALDGLTYTPPNGFTGTAALTVTTDDLGNTGGPAQQDVDTVQINVGALPTVSVNDPAAVVEGDAGSANSITFTVTLSAASNLPVTVPFSTANGTTAPATGGAACAANVDYLTSTGTLTFAPLDTSETFTVTVCADTLTEGNETLLVNLGQPTNATLGDGQGQGTITDDDVAGTLSFSAATAQVSENGGSVTLTVQRSGPGIAATGQPSSGAPSGSVPSGSVRPSAASSPSTVPATVSPAVASAVTVNFATANGTATSGLDYTATTGTLTFGVGETTKTIVIPILPDAVDEQPETFTVTLSAPTGGAAVGAVSTATVTITDADTTPCQTFLTSAVPAGSNVLPVVSQAGCSVGDTVAIDPGLPNEDRGTILGFGSIVIQQPTTQAHAAGAVVIRVTGGLPAAAPPVSLGDDSADDERVERERETEEERRQRARTNQGNKDDDAVEGDVIETHCDDPWPYVVIANRDGAVEVRLIKEAQAACSSIQPGDYLEADGDKQHEQLFHADSVEIKRRR